MNTEKKLTLLSYAIFFLLGILFTNWGIFIIYIHSSYSLTITTLGYLFFIPSTLQAISTYLNGFILDRINIKQELTLSFILLCIAIVILVFSHTLIALIFAFILFGISFGVLEGIANYIIVSLHPKSKFSKLNILNFFYSFGAIVGPAYAGYLLNIQWKWQWVFIISLGVGILFTLINTQITYGKIHADSNEPHSKLPIRWHFSIYLISLAMILYVLSECTFSYWIVLYLENNYHYTIGLASVGLTLFWIAIGVGRASAKLFSRLKIQWFIILFSLIAWISSGAILFLHNIIAIFTLIIVMGVGYSCLYASTLTYGTDQLNYNCPKLLSFLVICGTIGLILAFPISSIFVHLFSIHTALIFGNVLMIAMILLILLTLFDRKNPVL